MNNTSISAQRWTDRTVALVALVPVIAITTGTTTARAEIAPWRTDLIASYVANECREKRFSGVFALLEYGEPVFIAVCGQERYPEGKSISPVSRFKFFSLSKQFTAAAIAALADSGKLSTTDPLSKWVSEAPSSWASITVEQLLLHQSGVPNDLQGFFEVFGDDHEVAIVNWLKRNEFKGLNFKPGTATAYSNMGFELLALIGARAAQRPFDDVLRTYVFDPSGMGGAWVETGRRGLPGKPEGPDPDPFGLADGYIGNPGAPVPTTSFSFVQLGAGAIHGSVDDLIAYERALLRRTVLSASTQATMTDPTRLLVRNAGFGYGWILRYAPDGSPIHHHSGGANGYAVDYARLPNQKISIIQLSNFGFTDVDNNRDKIVSFLLHKKETLKLPPIYN